ncbi:hypothetical protein [Terribacillus saccharophilus]|uniref:hypothetical protein n=1 Tax=Terribacillus saccharophilus TaxID=361277 RepID=UPI0009FC1710|nr:hypothetical protein [Terribacillus goriensis]
MSNENNSVSPSEMNANELPDVPALQDEFTRDFLSSTEQTKEGYYSLESGSKGFNMDFPEDMIIGERSYNIAPENRSETIVIQYPSESIKNRKAFINMRINYYNSYLSVEHSKEQMMKSSGRVLEFKEIESPHENQLLEIAEYEDEALLVLAPIIWSEDGRMIVIHTTVNCKENVEKDLCLQSKEEQKQKAIVMLKSIVFM